jgi:hypothetical protein
LTAVKYVYAAMTATMAIGHFVFLRILLPSFRPGDWVGAMWRPLTAAILMFLAISPFDSRVASAGALASVATLGGLVIAGASIYFAALYVLWRIEGFPDGPEKLIVRKATAICGGVARRFRR